MHVERPGETLTEGLRLGPQSGKPTIKLTGPMTRDKAVALVLERPGLRSRMTSYGTSGTGLGRPASARIRAFKQQESGTLAQEKKPRGQESIQGHMQLKAQAKAPGHSPGLVQGAPRTPTELLPHQSN